MSSCRVETFLVLEALLDVGSYLRMPRLLRQLEDPLAPAQQVPLWPTRAFEVGSVADEELYTLQVTVLGCNHERGLHGASACGRYVATGCKHRLSFMPDFEINLRYQNE